MALALVDIFHELNQAHFAGELPLPKLEWNSRLSSSAGRFCSGSRRLLAQRPPRIEVASYLIDIADGEMHVRDTVLHEMIHYYLWHQNKPFGHTPEFHRIMKRVGAKRYNTVPKVRPVKHWYECPGCLRKIPAKRRLDHYACSSCCDRTNGGKFLERYRLRPSSPPVVVATPKTIIRPAPVENAQRGSAQAPSPVENAQRGSDLASSFSAEEKTNALLPPGEIVRRLEELKKLLIRS